MSVNRHQVEEVHATLDALYAAEKADLKSLADELRGKLDAVGDIKVGSPGELDDAMGVIKLIKAKRQKQVDEARGPLTAAEEETRSAAMKVETFEEVLVLPRSRPRARCRDDGCGGSCGECDPDAFCHELWCRPVPECAGKNCGEDGTGGLCGRCEEDQQCPDSQVCDEPTRTTSCRAECGGAPRGDVVDVERDDSPGRYQERLYEAFLRTPDALDAVIASGQARHQLNQQIVAAHAARAKTIASKARELASSKAAMKTNKSEVRTLQKALRSMKRDSEVTASELSGQQTRVDAANDEIDTLKKRAKALGKELSELKATHRRQESVVRECNAAQPNLSSMSSRYGAHVSAWRAAIGVHRAAQQAEAKARAVFVEKALEIKRSFAESLAEAESVVASLEAKAIPEQKLATLNGASDIDGLLNTPVIEGAEEMTAAVQSTLSSKRAAQGTVADELERLDLCEEEHKEADLECAEPCAVQVSDEDEAACKGCIVGELSGGCKPEALEELPAKEVLEGYEKTLDAQVDTLGAVAPLIPALMGSDERCRALRRAIVAERDRYGVQ